MSTAPDPKKRKSFTDVERQKLRLYHHTYPGLTPPQLASWFESQLGRKVSNSSVHDILSQKYAYLDSAEATYSLRKKKGPQWAELEAALFKWWQEVRPREVTGRELKLKAEEIWKSSPEFQGKKTPSLSDGWLSNWRARHGLGRSVTITDAKQASLEVERSDEARIMSEIGAPYFPRNIPSQISNPITLTCAPLFSLPVEGTLQTAHMTLQHSTHQMAIGASSPKIQALSTLKSSDQHITSFVLGETQVRDYRKNGYEMLQPSPSFDGANFSIPEILPKPSEYMVDSRTNPWYGIKELSLKCKSQMGHNQILPGKIMLEVLEPILRSLDFSAQEPFELPQWTYAWHDWKQHNVNTLNARKATRLLASSDCFRLRQAKENLEGVIYEEWFLDFMSNDAMRSASPGLVAIEDEPASSSTSISLPNFRQKGSSQYQISNLSSSTKGGRVDISARNIAKSENENDTPPVEYFQACITITPPADAQSAPQTIFHLETETSRFTTIRLTPTITFRNIRPKNSVIFKVAERGCSTELQLILSKGEASLSDCDPQGRSLINYALKGRNSSTLKFLLTSVDDINTYEVSPYAKVCPLIGVLKPDDWCSTFSERDKRLVCLKLMLEAGADPSLSYGGATHFEKELEDGTNAVIKALLDLGQPFVSANGPLDSFEATSSLFHIAITYNFPPFNSFEVHEKIFLLLGRGADIALCNKFGESCLQIVLQFVLQLRLNTFRDLDYQEEYKDILMCMVTAGASVYTSDVLGRTASQTACKYGHEELWREVLAECGYDPDEVFSLEDDFCYNYVQMGVCAECGYDPDDAFSPKDDFCPKYFQKHPGMRVFAAVPLKVRPWKLSFKEYGRQRKSFDCVRRVYNSEEVYYHVKWKEQKYFWETYVELSDSEDDEWISFNNGEGIDMAALYSDDMTATYPKLLHNGVPWQIAFS